MIVYDFFLTRILPLFVDLSKFYYGERIFFYSFVAVITFIILDFFLLMPYLVFKHFTRKMVGFKGKKGGKLW